MVETCAASALARLVAGERFALVLSDVRMPAMDGPAFVAAVRQRVPDIADAIVLMSADVRLADLDAPAPLLLAKPFDVAALVALVRERAAACEPTQRCREDEDDDTDGRVPV